MIGKLGLDVIAQAKSGTGKTIAFGIVALEMIDPNDPLPQVLIIAPTREIAVQTQDVIASIGRFMKKLKCHVFIGGFSVEEDWKKLERCQIVVGTPGRLEFLLSQKKLPIKSLRLVVLDEIDKLLDHNFRPVIRKIFTKLPSKKQVMVFSATYEEHLLKQLHNNYTYEPHHVMLAVNTPSLEGVTQYYQVVSPPLDDNWVGKYKFYEEKFKKLADLLSQVPFYQCIVFINHRGRAADLANYLTKNGWTAMNISGGLDQKARLKTMSKARNFQLRVLVCSDLIARGIDIERVNLVVNIDMPKDPETYLHRVGRTGRYGTYGLAISFVDKDEMEFLEHLQTHYDVKMEPLPDVIPNEHHQRPLASEADMKAYEKLSSAREKIEMKGDAIPVILTKPESENIEACMQDVTDDDDDPNDNEQDEEANSEISSQYWDYPYHGYHWTHPWYAWPYYRTAPQPYYNRYEGDFIPPDIPF